MPAIDKNNAEIQLEIFISEAIRAEIEFSRAILLEVKQWKLSGMSDNEIYKTLEDRFYGQSSSVSSMLNKQGTALWQKMKGLQFNAVFNTFDEDAIYEWVKNDAAQSCRQCIERDGQQKPFKIWKQIGLPTTGSTDCRHNCACGLKRISPP